jgi:hypothetical protein
MANGVYISAAELLGAVLVLCGICGTLIKLIWDRLHKDIDDLKGVVKELKAEVKTVHHLGSQLQIYIRLVEDLEIRHAELKAEMKRPRR